MLLYGGYLMSQLSQYSELTMLTSKKTQAQQENMILFADMFNYYANIGVSRFVWSGLPETVDERLLNMGLFFSGNVAFFNHEMLGLIALPCNNGNRFNLLYQPIEVTAYGYDYSFTLRNLVSTDPSIPEQKFGFVRATPSGIPQALYMAHLLIRMADVLRALDVLCQRMKRPYVILCDEKERMTMVNLFKNIKDNEDLILGMKDYNFKNGKSVEIAPTPSPENLKSLWDSYKEYETQLLTMMGIDNKGYDKKERLLVDEVNANNMLINFSSVAMEKEINLGLSRVNEMFGTNITVQVKTMNDTEFGGAEDV